MCNHLGKMPWNHPQKGGRLIHCLLWFLPSSTFLMRPPKLTNWGTEKDKITVYEPDWNHLSAQNHRDYSFAHWQPDLSRVSRLAGETVPHRNWCLISRVQFSSLSSTSQVSRTTMEGFSISYRTRSRGKASQKGQQKMYHTAKGASAFEWK